MSAETAHEVAEQYIFRSLGDVAVRGRAEHVEVFAVDEGQVGSAAPIEAPGRTVSPSE